MWLAFGTAVALGATWVELTAGLPAFDDLTSVKYGSGPDEIWAGMQNGDLWHSSDGGETYRLAFRPTDAEPVVAPGLRNRRASNVSDFGRGTGRDIPARDRAALAERAADLAGAVRDRARDVGAALLGSVVREGGRDRVAIRNTTNCGESTVFAQTPESLWRSHDNGWSWERINVGPAGATNDIYWLTCDDKRPGHLAVNTAAGVLESFDWGDSFAFWSNPQGEAVKPNRAIVDERGLLVTTIGTRVWAERPDRRGYELLCQLTGDSVEADRLDWAWYVAETGEAYAVTEDGVVVCNRERSWRMTGEWFARRIVTYVWVDWTLAGHLFVATDYEVYESFDWGATFDQVFVSPTERTIRRIAMHPSRPGDLLVATGGQIYRRIAAPAAAGRAARGAAVEARIGRLLAQAPLWEVVRVGLERLELDPGTVGARRDDLRLRSLLPQVAVRVSHRDGLTRTAETDRLLWRAGAAFDASDPMLGSRLDRDRTIWSAFAFWDLRDLLLDPLQTDRSWADVERLRQRMTFRLQDTWALWARETVALDNPGLTVRQRAYHELSRREAAAYLDQMTGGRFAAFAASAP